MPQIRAKPLILVQQVPRKQNRTKEDINLKISLNLEPQLLLRVWDLQGNKNVRNPGIQNQNDILSNKNELDIIFLAP